MHCSGEVLWVLHAMEVYGQEVNEVLKHDAYSSWTPRLTSDDLHHLTTEQCLNNKVLLNIEH